jgi:polysaccharide chain length determinant protein (PEP-CTERM system associated)
MDGLHRHTHDRARDSVVSSGRQPYAVDAILTVGWRRRWQIVIPAIVVTAAASWWIHRLPNRYRSDSLLLTVSQRVPETFVHSAVTTRGENRLQSITQQIVSRTQLEQIIRDFDLYAERRKTSVMQDVVDAMRLHDIEIQAVKGDAFRLGFIADDPETAMRVADRLSSLFIGQTSFDRATLADGTDQFLEAQLEEARRKLVDNERRLEDYRRRHNGELPRQHDANVQGLHDTDMQIQVLADSLNRDRDRQLMLERSLKEASFAGLIEAAAPVRPRATPAEGSNPTASEQLERAEATLKEMRSTLTEQHPDIVALKQAVADLRKRAEAERARHVESGEAGAADRLRRGRLEELREGLAAVERQIAQKMEEGDRLRAGLLNYQKRIEVEPTREAELAALTRDYDTLQETYRGLLARKQESQIAANLEHQQIGAQFRVLDPARLPERPFAPKRAPLYAAAGLGGLGIGLVFALILEYFDRGLRTEQDVRFALGLPVLAAIPLVATRRSGVRRATTALSIGTGVLACAAAIAWRLLN